MSLLPISLTTVGSQAETIVEAPASRQYELKFLSGFKDSTYTINISIESARGFQTILTETITGGGTFIIDNPIVINPGERLVSQSSTSGININGTFQANSYV